MISVKVELSLTLDRKKELYMEITQLQQVVEVIKNVLCDVCNQSTQLEFGVLSANWRLWLALLHKPIGKGFFSDIIFK